jgi:ADP-L-glycero-D-manno-heptose 6-epimerase
VYVGDCTKVNLWFMEHAQHSGIFNLGTGRAQTFNDIARAVVAWHKQHRKVDAQIAYIPFPEHLHGAYQNYTQADISALRRAGYEHEFLDVSQGVSAYMNWLNRE